MTVRHDLPPPEPDGRIAFILSLARALHESGHATHRLETALEATSRHLGLIGQYFATPTSIFASFGTAERQQTFMLRTNPTPPDLGKLVRTTEVARAVLEGRLKPDEGTGKLDDLKAVPPPPVWATIIAFVLASAAAARFLGGGFNEVALAAAAGLATGSLAMLVRRLPNLRGVYELLAAATCSFGVGAVGAMFGRISIPIATLAGLIVLVPGLTLTTAIAELANGHLTAGTSRMASAFMTFIGIGFGVALGGRLVAVGWRPAGPVTVAAMPEWTIWLALLASALAFAILLRADRSDWGWIVAAGVVAYLATGLGSALLGGDLGVFVGALTLGLVSNGFSRRTGRPSAVMLVPGLLTLVPGSVGFRSITALLESQVVTGIDAAFTMVLTAVSLVAGLLTSAAVYPERPLA